MPYSIGPISEPDLKDVVALIREFAEFEDLLAHCEVTVERLRTAMFGSSRVVEGLIARDADEPVGYCLFFPNFSSFRGHRGLYLDDIYVTASHRGAGLGEAMLREVARKAAERGFERIDFLVLDWNEPAMAFYKKLGAVEDPSERHLKFTDEAFGRLASDRK